MKSAVNLQACRLLLAVALAVLPAALAEAATSAERVQQHLAAGEFAPALAIANQADAASRDGLLRQIAQAQDDAGAAVAARNTLRMLGDDRARAGALNQIRAQRLAGANFNPNLAQFGGGGIGGGGLGVGGGGGGQNRADQADFEALIDLIQSTVDPDSWDEVGGPGAIAEFPGGVLVDAQGTVKRIVQQEQNETLATLRRQASAAGANDEVRAESKLRKVSLNRLEREIQLRRAEGRQPTEAMELLAGLQEIKYVFVYPDTGDIVLAGPAGDWRSDAEGRAVAVDGGKPVVRLEDFVVILRHMLGSENARFGCSIDPKRENLAATQAFLAESAKQPLAAGRAARQQWLEQVRATLGKQDVDVFGIDPQTRVGHVLVEADYRMKLIGMGLEEGTLGVESYLASIDPAQGAPTLGVLRWWFTMNYDAIKASKQHDVFALEGQGVKLLSENEMLAEAGERIATGKSDALNQQFARSFTKHFPALAAKYPIYAELKNLFDLALVAALIEQEDLAGRCNWHMVHFLDADGYQVSRGPAPREVDTIINHRMINRTQIVAGVSGGVRVDPAEVLKTSVQVDNYGLIQNEQQAGKPGNLPATAWWWD